MSIYFSIFGFIKTRVGERGVCLTRKSWSEIATWGAASPTPSGSRAAMSVCSMFFMSLRIDLSILFIGWVCWVSMLLGVWVIFSIFFRLYIIFSIFQLFFAVLHCLG